MGQVTSRDLAYSMLRMWGNQASRLAREYASDFENRNICVEAAKWYDVERIVDRCLMLAQRHRPRSGLAQTANFNSRAGI
jgi:hypothetical protein